MKKGMSLLTSAIIAASFILPANISAQDIQYVYLSSDGSSIESNVVYKITAKHSGKALDVEGGYTHDGANVQQWSDNGNTQQQWKVVAVGGGYYKLIAMHSGKALDVEGGYTHDGANVQQWSDNGSSHQRWRIESTGDGYYKLVAECSGKALDVAGGYTHDGANVQQWSDNGNEQQKWKFTRVSDSDKEAPSMPINFKVVSQTKNSVTFRWDPSTDNVGVEGYDIYLDNPDNYVGSTSVEEYTLNNLSTDHTYTIYIQAKDAAGNRSNKNSFSAKLSFEDTKDTQAPTMPSQLKITNVGTTQANLAWQASTDNVGVTGYDIYVNGSFVTTVNETRFAVTGLTPNTTYTIGVQAKDAAGNKSDIAAINVTTAGEVTKDTQAPTKPENLKTLNKTGDSLTMGWQASTDNVGVTGYDVYVNGAFKGTSTSTSYTITGLSANTTYEVKVQAKDAAGNKSEFAVTTAQTTKVSTNKGFYINGTTLYDANGVPFVMRGINYPYAWYKGKEDVAIPAIAATNANCVRIVVTDGLEWPEVSISELQHIIQLCEQNNLIAIVEVHDKTGSDDVAVLEHAAQYWKRVKNALIGHEKTVILNIHNEWFGSWDDSNGWAAGYQKVIPELRDAGIKNTIMVDCAGYGQWPTSIFQAAGKVAQADKLSNTLFSIHMYEYAGKQGVVKSNIDQALATGYPVVIGEFGIRHTNGDVDEKTIMDYCQEKGVGYIGWSWIGNGDTWSYLDMVTDFAGGGLTEQGRAIIEGENGIRKTSKRCTVFEQSTKDQEAPTVPQNLKGAPNGCRAVDLSWDASSDNVGVAKYNIYMNGELVDIASTNKFTVENLKASTTYKFSVSALDEAGNESAKSTTITVTTPESDDHEAPTVPTNLTGAGSVTTAKLSWSKSKDNVGVAGYNIYQDGVKVGTTTKTEYTASKLTKGKTYTFAVTAFDDAGNESAKSKAVEVSTTGTSDTGIKPGILAEYDDWYVGINAADKTDTPTKATISKLENGGLSMDFDLRTENYPCFQVDPAVTADWSNHKTMNIIVTNPNDKEIQLTPIVKDGNWKWTEPIQYQSIPAKTTKMITVPLAKIATKSANRISFRVQSGGGGFAGSIQLNGVDFDLAEGAYASQIAEMNRPKTASYYPWNHKDSSYGKTVEAGLKGETIYCTFKGVTDQNDAAAGVSTETKPGMGTSQDWSQYGSVSCTITNKGAKPVHVALVARTLGGWIWQETGGQTATDDTPERIIKPGETVDVVYDLSAPIWKSEKTDWVNNAPLADADNVKAVQFKVYAGKGEGPVDGSIEITNFKLNF